MISSSDFLRFLVEKKSLKENLKLQLAHIDGSEVKTSDKKIHDFPITKLGKRRKIIMAELIEIIVIRAQQDFDIVGGLNPIQIEIENDRIINTLKKHKNVIYKITHLGLLFLARVTNDTKPNFHNSKRT